MNKEEENETRNFIGLLSDLKDIEVKVEKDELSQYFDMNNFEEEFINDYISLKTINSIKKEPKYYFSKWSIILIHLIKLDDFFFYLKKRDIVEEKKERRKKDKNKKLNNSSITSNSSESSLFYSSVEGSFQKSNKNIKSEGNIKTTRDLYEFKLDYIKKGLNIFEIENMDGNSFEIYAKNTFSIMLLLLKIDYYKLLNPKEVIFNKLYSIYKLNTKEPDLPEIKSEQFEIDLIINGFFHKDFDLLINQFSNHFFF